MTGINYIMMAVIAVMLFVAAIGDIRNLAVSRVFIGFLILACIVALLTQDNPDILAALMGTLIGICAIGISMISEEQIGRGDGFIIAALGIVAGFRGSLVVVFVASIVMCFVSIILLILKKASRKTKLPFIPAIFVGYMVFWINSYSITGAGLL